MTDEKPTPNHEALIVEDQPAVSRLLVRILARYGYDGLVFEDAESALAVFKADPSRFTIVFTDYGLPGMDGLQMTREAKQLSPQTPVLICSGGNEDLSPERMHEAGVDGTLEKPFQMGDVERCIKRFGA